MTNLFRVPGASLAFERIGSGQASPLVVLHGGPGEPHDYLRPHFDCLVSERHDVVYYDQRGSGASKLDAGVAFADWQIHVRDVEAMRLHLCQDRLTLVGFSWGALLALLYALEHPNRVEQLILVSPVPVRAADMAIVAKNLDRAASRVEMNRLRAHLAREGRDPGQERFLLNVAACLVDPFVALTLTSVLPNAEAADATLRSLGDFDLHPRLGTLSMIPTVIVHGREDPVSAFCAASTAEALGATSIVVDACGHAPFVEAKDEFFALMRRVLNDVDRRRAVR